MIQIKNKIHDKFSVEFKVGFSGNNVDTTSDFSVNAWIFIPNSLDINAATYSKEQFYKNVKSNLRLITPDFSLKDLADPSARPLQTLMSAGKKLAETPNQYALREFEFQVKMFASIFKSALRNQTEQLVKTTDIPELANLIASFSADVQDVTNQYRTLSTIVSAHQSAQTIFHYGDEFMSHIVGVQATKVVRCVDALEKPELETSRETLIQLIQRELEYKIKQQYSHITADDDQENRELISRHGLLKKYVESALYLKVDTTPDGSAAQQITFGIAAGIAMIISTLIALPFQKYLGNYPFIIFIVLVIAYMFKDRIKELIRNKFAYRLKKKYFDKKTTLDFQGDKIGWIKEGMDFISDAKTPDEVLKIRNRSGIEENNQLLEEKTILYRKLVHINNDLLRNRNNYLFTGIHDILRLHIQHFTQKMDNPELRVDSVDASGNLCSVNVDRIYTFHIVLQFNYDQQVEYHGFRITATRNGIVDAVRI